MLKATAIAIVTALACTATTAFADDPHGVWVSADRDTKARISNCGDKLCGRVVWLGEPIDPATGKPKTG